MNLTCARVVLVHNEKNNECDSKRHSVLALD